MTKRYNKASEIQGIDDCLFMEFAYSLDLSKDGKRVYSSIEENGIALTFKDELNKDRLTVRPVDLLDSNTLEYLNLEINQQGNTNKGGYYIAE